MPDPTTTDPDNYKVVFENEPRARAQVPRLARSADAAIEHPDSVMVTLSGFERRLSGAEGESRDVRLEPGQVRWLDAQTHSGENIGTTDSHVVFVELKEPGVAQPGSLGPPDAVKGRNAAAVVSTAFVAAAAGIFVVGDEWDSAPSGLFLVWLGVHVVYGALLASFWALPVALLVPVAIAPLPWDGDDTALWAQAAFAELFYGIPFVFIGVVGRRLWRARRPAELPAPQPREEAQR